MSLLNASNNQTFSIKSTYAIKNEILKEDVKKKFNEMRQKNLAEFENFLSQLIEKNKMGDLEQRDIMDDLKTQKRWIYLFFIEYFTIQNDNVFVLDDNIEYESYLFAVISILLFGKLSTKTHEYLKSENDDLLDTLYRDVINSDHWMDHYMSHYKFTVYLKKYRETIQDQKYQTSTYNDQFLKIADNLIVYYDSYFEKHEFHKNEMIDVIMSFCYDMFNKNKDVSWYMICLEFYYDFLDFMKVNWDSQDIQIIHQTYDKYHSYLEYFIRSMKQFFMERIYEYSNAIFVKIILDHEYQKLNNENKGYLFKNQCIIGDAYNFDQNVKNIKSICHKLSLLMNQNTVNFYLFTLMRTQIEEEQNLQPKNKQIITPLIKEEDAQKNEFVNHTEQQYESINQIKYYLDENMDWLEPKGVYEKNCFNQFNGQLSIKDSNDCNKPVYFTIMNGYNEYIQSKSKEIKDLNIITNINDMIDFSKTINGIYENTFSNEGKQLINSLLQQHAFFFDFTLKRTFIGMKFLIQKFFNAPHFISTKNQNFYSMFKFLSSDQTLNQYNLKMTNNDPDLDINDKNYNNFVVYFKFVLYMYSIFVSKKHLEMNTLKKSQLFQKINSIVCFYYIYESELQKELQNEESIKNEKNVNILKMFQEESKFKNDNFKWIDNFLMGDLFGKKYWFMNMLYFYSKKKQNKEIQNAIKDQVYQFGKLSDCLFQCFKTLNKNSNQKKIDTLITMKIFFTKQQLKFMRYHKQYYFQSFKTLFSYLNISSKDVQGSFFEDLKSLILDIIKEIERVEIDQIIYESIIQDICLSLKNIKNQEMLEILKKKYDLIKYCINIESYFFRTNDYNFTKLIHGTNIDPSASIYPQNTHVQLIKQYENTIEYKNGVNEHITNFKEIQKTISDSLNPNIEGSKLTKYITRLIYINKDYNGEILDLKNEDQKKLVQKIEKLSKKNVQFYPISEHNMSKQNMQVFYISWIQELFKRFEIENKTNPMQVIKNYDRDFDNIVDQLKTICHDVFFQKNNPTFQNVVHFVNSYDDILPNMKDQQLKTILKMEHVIFKKLYDSKSLLFTDLQLQSNYFILPFIIDKYRKNILNKPDYKDMNIPNDTFDLYEMFYKLRYFKHENIKKIKDHREKSKDYGKKLKDKNDLDKKVYDEILIKSCPIFFNEKNTRITMKDEKNVEQFINLGFFLPPNSYHGTSSATLVSISKFMDKDKQGLVPTGMLLDQNIAPLTGELKEGINKNFVNATKISVVCFGNLQEAKEYAKKSISTFKMKFDAIKEQTMKLLEPTELIKNVEDNLMRIRLNCLRLSYFGKLDKEVGDLIGQVENTITKYISDNNAKQLQKELEKFKKFIQYLNQRGEKMMFTMEECKFLGCSDQDKPIELVFGLYNANDYHIVNSGVKCEMGLDGIQQFGKDIQVVYVKKESMETMNRYIQENMKNKLIVLDMDLLNYFVVKRYLVDDEEDESE